MKDSPLKVNGVRDVMLEASGYDDLERSRRYFTEVNIIMTDGSFVTGKCRGIVTGHHLMEANDSEDTVRHIPMNLENSEYVSVRAKDIARVRIKVITQDLSIMNELGN